MTAYDIAIVGGGVMGAAAACEAARRGASVVLIDQSPLPNPRGASIDHSKVFRFSYPDSLYTRMAVEALTLWRGLEQETGARLFTPTGLLLIGQQRPPSFESQVYDVLRSLGHQADMLTSVEAAARFPQFNREAFSYAVFDPSGAILHAGAAVRALIELAARRGVSVVECERVTRIDSPPGSRTAALVTGSGNSVECERVLVASGPWTLKLLPVIGDRLSVTRQEVLYFRPPAGCEDSAGRSPFETDRFPIFFAMDTGFYGFPVHHRGAMKIADHNKGPSSDPDLFDDTVSQNSIADCRAFFTRLIPGLADSALVETRVCLYNNTPDDDFIIDWHPEMQNVLIATGFSGHGFKFGSLIGRIAAELLLDGWTAFSLERFRLARFK